MTSIKTEVEIELTPDIIARVFAHMGSDQQAEFFALAFAEMETYEACPGPMGRQTQMIGIAEGIKKMPKAMEWFEDMDEFLWPTEDDEAPTSGFAPAKKREYPELPTEGVFSATVTAEILEQNAEVVKKLLDSGTITQEEFRQHYMQQPWDSAGASPLEDMRAAIRKVEEDCGTRPNVMVMGSAVWSALTSYLVMAWGPKGCTPAVMERSLMGVAVEIDPQLGDRWAVKRPERYFDYKKAETLAMAYNMHPDKFAEECANYVSPPDDMVEPLAEGDALMDFFSKRHDE